MGVSKLISFALIFTFIYFVDGANFRNSTKATFYNPIEDFSWPDPYAYLHTDGWYYMPRRADDRRGIDLFRSRILSNWRNAERITVYRTPDGMDATWAPEIHFLQGDLYIYLAIQTNGNNANHRMYVTKCNNPANPMGGWSTAYRMPVPGEDYWAIDGTVMQYSNGRNYFIWSGWPQIDSGFPQNLYIAALCLDNPMRICSDRVLIKGVDYPWEQHGEGLIEGPQVLQNAGRTFLIYSASGSWTPDYQLGMMGIDDGRDPLNYDSWWRHDQPVFWRNNEAGVYGVGHASFTTSPDGSENWIVYHAMSQPDAGWDGRTARIQKFGWNPDNSPAFPRPTGFGTPLEGPSGE